MKIPRFLRPTLPLALLTLFTFSMSLAQAAPDVILKLDDLRQGKGGATVPPGWARVVDYLADKKIKCTIGIIGNSLEDAPDSYVKWIQEKQATGLVEFWNHGYTHGQDKEAGTSEFKGISEAEQLENLKKTQDLFKDKVGFPLQVFGAPFNHMDGNTAAALKSTPEIKVWYYGNKAANSPNLLVLERFLNMENRSLKPDADAFKKAYESKNAGEKEVLTLQGHSGYWNDEDFAEFEEMIAFLQAEGCTFVTALEYAEKVR